MSDAFQPQLKLILDGDEFFTFAIEAIQKATREILVETYIFDLDQIGSQVLDALAQARKRGVTVLLLCDGIGSYFSQNDLKQACERLDIPIRFFHPIPRGRWGFFSFEIRKWIRFWKVFNNRDHRKVILVDQSIVFIGSLNITQVHSRKVMGEKAWRDTALKLKCEPVDPDLIRLRQAFLSTWHRSKPKRFLRFPIPHLKLRNRTHQFRWLRINDQISVRMSLARDLRNRIKEAKTRVLITNAYFLPRTSLTLALRKAARRGVFVGLCLPYKTDVWFVREASRSLFRKLLKDNIRIFEYQPSVLHAKTIVIDDWASVGSYNLNHRSSLHDLEVEVAVTEPTTVKQLIRAWDQDLRLSTPMTLHRLNQDTIFRRTLARLLYLLRYFL